MSTPLDTLTILTHSRSRLAKLWQADGTISSYDETKYYQVDERQVAGIDSLSEALTVLESLPHSAVIRGKFKGAEASATIDADEHKQGLARKIKALYDDAPHHWVMIDVDKFTPVADPALDPEAAITEYITASLPAAFHDISCHWQLSSSAGHPSSAGVLSAHLWFWLSTPATSDDLKLWAKSGAGGHGLGLDSSVFNSVQFHWTSAPLFADGVADPVPRRSGLFAGLFGDTVEITIKNGSNSSYTGTSSYQNTSSDLAVWDDDLMGLSPTLNWSLEFGREVLFDLDADGDRATWVSDLAALHHEFSGSAEALELAVEWSETASNFGSRKDVEDRWASFGKYRGEPITGRWLLKRRTERHAHLKYDARSEWAKALEGAADEFTVREKLCPQIAKDSRLDDLGKESLSQLLFDAFKRLGTKYPIAECRKLLVEKRATKNLQKNEMPAWAQPWVYITNDDKFFRPDSEEWLSVQGFNASFNRELPADEDGARLQSAAWACLNEMELSVVTKAVYLPWAAHLFTLNGVKCVNTYRPSSTPVPVARLSPDDHGIVNRVVEHIKLLAGGRPEVVTTMLDWLAHNVQKPGVKIRWAPLWKGVEGDGKTVMGALLASVMGRVNVRNVSPKVLGTDFTGWAEGAAVAVLEEIKLTGHNRYDILNALKPFITNDSIEVHPKGQDTHEGINTTNYVAFTNYTDALPLTDTDRRWWIVFTPFMSKDEMEAAVQAKGLAVDLGVYFDDLHDAINQHPAVLRRWLLDYVISDAFRPNGSAPMTAEKAVMIGMSSSDDEDAVRDVLLNCEASDLPGEERGATRGVTPILFSSRCMGDALVLSDTDVAINTTSRNRLFSKVGFTKLTKKVKWNGEAHLIWVKGAQVSEPDEVRRILDKTLQKKGADEKEGVFGEKGSICDDLF